MADGTLSFEVDGEMLHVLADAAGIRRLQVLRGRLLEAAGHEINEDAHIFAESWGGYDLNELPMLPGTTTMKQVNFRVLLSRPTRHDA